MNVLVAASLTALVATTPAFAADFSNVYFFGDSLTDTGNVMQVYAGIPHAPGSPSVIPGPPYDPDGRASNGLIYADVLAAGLGFNAQASTRGGNNYAFGGARTRYQLFGPPFLGVADQVAQYRALPGPADGSALYVLWAGSNNLQDILSGRTVDVLGNPIPGVSATLSDIGGMINGLYAEGARNLLVPNVANLARVPRISVFGAAAQAQATALAQAYNAGLQAMLDQLQAADPGLKIYRFDTFAAVEDLVANAPALGFTNTVDRCYTGDDIGFTGGGTVCANPDQYLFWDGIHPTAAAHRLLGQEMLAAVPEPATFVTMAIGILGLSIWRRRRAAGSGS